MVTMGFDDVSLQKYGQSSYEHCYVHQWGVLWGVFRNVPNSRAVVTLFGGEWLLGFCFDDVSLQKYGHFII